jgi:hypothetical protein
LFGTVVEVVVVVTGTVVVAPFGAAVMTGVDTTGICAWPTATVVAGAADVLGAFTTMSSAGAAVVVTGRTVVVVAGTVVVVVTAVVVVGGVDRVSATASHLYVPPHGSPKTPLLETSVTEL